MTMTLIHRDKEQRQLALDASQSFIVKAPAGSGKTELLIQRFLTLLNYVSAPEEILAITFTKKAANEMRTRVIKALKHALADPEPDSLHAKQTWLLARKVLQRDKQFNWNLISNPNQLRIQTIDALCAYLTKQLPLLSHFGSQPDIAINPASLYREAVQEVLMHVEEDYEWSQALSQLLLHLDNDLNKLHDLLVSLLAKRDQWLPYIQLDTNDAEIKKQLERHLELVITDSLRTVLELFPKAFAAELIAILRYAANNLAIAHSQSDIVACQDMTALPSFQAQDKKLWLGIARLLLTNEGSWRKSLDTRNGFPAVSSLTNPQEKNLAAGYKQRISTLISALYDHDDLRLVLSELKYLPEAHYLKDQWVILKSLLYVLKIVAAQLRVTFQQYGQIDFIENAQAALSALGNDEHPTDLALALDYQIRHVLVDEFQDTSFTQYQLLEKLTLGWEKNDGRTLFVVGDPMQSIYRFREAEVGLFIRMCNSGIGHIKLTPLTLAMNFRSTATIVEWNNTHFERIFPSFNDIATGAVNYSPSVTDQGLLTTFENTTIEIRGFLDGDDQMQADHIVAFIAETKNKYPDEKIAILVRARQHLATIIPTLKKANLPYRAINIDPLASRQIIQDLFSLTRALLHPADRISWLALLRAPWCGLTLADLLIIAGKNPYNAIWEELERTDVIQQISADGRMRLARILPLLKIKMAERERHDLRSWIESTWLLLGGPACLEASTDMDDANAFFKLLEEFGQTNQVLNLNKLKEKLNELFADTQHDDAALQIMTIHSAKGLEFDTVILPHLERKNSHDNPALLSWMERPLTNDKVALLLAPIHAIGNEKDPIYEYINRQQKIKSDYERDRLFYVAATRAKKRLHLFFNATKKENSKENGKENDDIKIESGSFLQKLWPFIETQKQQIISYEPDSVVVSSQENEIQLHRYTKRITATWQNPIVNVQVTKMASHKESGFQLADAKPRLIGVVIHRVLQQLSQLGTSWWQEKNKNLQTDYLKHQLMQHGLLPDDSESAVQMAYNAIQNTLADTRGKWILHSHQEAKSEFAITAVMKGEVDNLIIDRTFIDETGTRWIIDYKSSAFTHHDLDHFLAREQEKYLKQMHKYSQAMKLIDNRLIRLGLYFPALPAWKEIIFS
jgi:ATP-dependent helicase/nuclease subunit A